MKTAPCVLFFKEDDWQWDQIKIYTFELETLAIIYALRRFRTYLLGLKFKFVINCQELSLTNKKETNPEYCKGFRDTKLRLYPKTIDRGSRILYVFNRQMFAVEDKSFDRNLALCQSDDPVIVKIRAISVICDKCMTSHFEQSFSDNNQLYIQKMSIFPSLC